MTSKMTAAERAYVLGAIDAFFLSRRHDEGSISTSHAVGEVRKKIGGDTLADRELVNLIAEAAVNRRLVVSFD